MKMYRDYKTFNIDFLKRYLRESLENHNSYDYSFFQNIFIALLNKHAPTKKNIIRFNNNTFMSKAFRKTFIIITEQKTTGQITKNKETFA